MSTNKPQNCSDTKPSKIYVAGHLGMVGSATVRHLLEVGNRPENIITRSHAELDITEQSAVQKFFAKEKPNQVYLGKL